MTGCTGCTERARLAKEAWAALSAGDKEEYERKQAEFVASAKASVLAFLAPRPPK